MKHEDHVHLIQDGVPEGGTWADLGAGSGAFTLALAQCLGHGHIFAVDLDGRALRIAEQALARQGTSVTVQTITGDFTRPLSLPPLDGILMANALHYCRDKAPVLRLLRRYLRPGGRFLLVEYNTDRGNRWVPHPLSYPTWEDLARRSGFTGTTLLATRPSSFLGAFFAAVSYVPAAEGG